jgi:hypothetical protein
MHAFLAFVPEEACLLDVWKDGTSTARINIVRRFYAVLQAACSDAEAFFERVMQRQRQSDLISKRL